MSIGKFPEMLSQQILVGIILVGRLDVDLSRGELLHHDTLVHLTILHEGRVHQNMSRELNVREHQEGVEASLGQEAGEDSEDKGEETCVTSAFQGGFQMRVKYHFHYGIL